ADSKEDVKAANFLEYLQNEWILNMIIRGDFDLNLNMKIEPSEQMPELAGRCDFIGINYYMRIRVKGAKSKIPGIPGYEIVPCSENCTDMGWEIYPKGIRYELNWAYRLYRRPLMVTENGIADAKDEKRSDFLKAHICEVERAINEDGVPVEGYFYWSLIDNFEWARGFKMRFGLFSVDYETKRRTPTKAVRVYREIIEKSKTL
ncbi:glycoside hydrolase family 1 protein, partial [Candidatus Woesearchaeota archaeon]